MSDTEDEMSSGNEQSPAKEMVDDTEGEENHVVMEEKKQWSKGRQVSLVQAVRSGLAAKFQAYTEEKINWSSIEEKVGFKGCEHKFMQLLSSVRHFRTMDEVTADMLTLLRAPELSESNKICDEKNGISQGKGKGKKNQVKKPRSAYNIYTSEVMKTGLVSFADVSLWWKRMSKAELIKYTEMSITDQERYVKEMQQYLEDHPDNTEMKKQLSAATATLRNKAKFGKTSNSSSIEHYLTKPTATTVDKDSAEESRELDASSHDTPVFESPKKKRHSENSPKKRHSENSPAKSQTPKKKKRKSERVWTAESLFVDTKRQEYKADHPEFDDETIESKLARKFAKMSQTKQGKYQKLADERNS